jgi:hypothetical protein
MNRYFTSHLPFASSAGLDEGRLLIATTFTVDGLGTAHDYLRPINAAQQKSRM